MAKRKLTDYFLYRHRLGLAVGSIFIALLALLVVAAIVPGGITSAEQASVVTSMQNGLSFGVNAPYSALQHASIERLGLTVLAIKLPSLLLGLLLGISVFFLLKRWLPATTAIFASLVIFSSTTFLSIVGTGTPAMLYLLYPTLLLLFGTRVLAHGRGVTIFTILLIITTALAMMTPTLIYLVVLAAIITAYNPHVRYGFRRLPKFGLVLLVGGFIAAFVPVGLVIWRNPSSVMTLLGAPQTLSFGSIVANAKLDLKLFGNFLHPGIVSGMIAPVVGLATVGLAVLGLYHIIRALPSARSQFLLGWTAIAVIITLVNPTLASVLYLPIVLLAAFGLAEVIAIWYRTFPLNPYARISAMVPIGILIIGIVAGSSLRYVNTALYASGSANLYSRDLTLLHDYLANDGTNTPVMLAVGPSEREFYATLTTIEARPVNTTTYEGAATVGGTVLSTQPLTGRTDLKRILTDARSDQADRFYVYVRR